MGLLDVVRNAVDNAFDIIDAFTSDIEYCSYEDTDFSVTSGEGTDRYASQAGVQVLMEDYLERDIDGTSIQAKDKKVSIPYKNLDFVPKTKDKIIETSGNEWVVMDFDPSTDPVNALYILQCRRVK